VIKIVAMKKLNLRNPSYQYIEIAFKEWLDILGYSKGIVNGTPVLIREFLHYLENNGVHAINNLQSKHIKKYYEYISIRANQRRGGGLNTKTINQQIKAIEKLLEYLQQKGVQGLPSCNIQLEKVQKKEIIALSIEEIKELFELTKKEVNTEKEEILQARDKTILVIYYSCGLRRNEGINVSVDDINFDTRILHVRKGKNYKERFVPISKLNAEYLKEWIYDYRSKIVKDKKEHRLFIGLRGELTTSGTLYTRLRLLQQQSENTELTEKIIGLHTLRHSIATHLLKAGMSIEKIAKFLGHSSLESTQIYTHLI
jgi:integrase/recombinase XerD